MIGDEIKITVVEVRGETVQLGIDAPRSISIYRDEIYSAILEANREAANEAPESLGDLGEPSKRLGPEGRN